MIKIYTKNLINILMPILQGDPRPKDPDIPEYDQVEHYHVTFPKELVKSKQLRTGDDLAYMIVGGDVVPQAGDILIRKVR